MSSALFPLALAAAGLPIVVGGVALIARRSVYRHADQYGPAIRAAGRDMPAPRNPQPAPKELTHR